MRTGDDWMARVVCGTHNHAPASYTEGHPYPGRLSKSKIQLTVHLSTKNVKPRDILTSLKKKNPDNMSTIETIYNARKKFRIAEKASKTQMQVVMSFLQREGYIFESRTNAVTNELEDLFFAHPGSLERWRAFPHVLLMDAICKTNRYCFSLFYLSPFSFPAFLVIYLSPFNEYS